MDEPDEELWCPKCERVTLHAVSYVYLAETIPFPTPFNEKLEVFKRTFYACVECQSTDRLLADCIIEEVSCGRLFDQRPSFRT